MASHNDTRVCRLCRALVPSKRAVSLFTTIGVQEQWSKRIESLLNVPVAASDGLSGYICLKCKLRPRKGCCRLARVQGNRKVFRICFRTSEGPLKADKVY